MPVYNVHVYKAVESVCVFPHSYCSVTPRAYKHFTGLKHFLREETNSQRKQKLR